MGTFFYDARGRLRAAWRLALFIALLFSLSAILGAPLLLFFPQLAGPEPPAQPSPALNRLALLLDGYLLIPLLLATWLMTRYIDRRPFASLGLSPRADLKRELLQGLALGLGMGMLYLLVGLLTGVLHFTANTLSPGILANLALLTIGFLLAALFEELLFHGYILQTMLEGIGIYPTLFLISVVFSLFHRANPDITLLGLINIALASLLLALGYLKTRALWLPIGVHFSWNIFQVLCGFRVSGLEFGPGLVQAQLRGAATLSGGPFGPEGGLITTAIFITAITFVLVSKRIKPHPEMAALWREHIRPAFGRELEL